MNVNGKWYTETELEAYIVTLEHRLAQTEDKHLGECRQISEYDIEVRQLRELLHRVRSFYGQEVSWVDIFEDDYMKLTGGNV